MQLIYRGQTFETMPRHVTASPTLRAVNWRYQMPGTTYPQNAMPSSSYQTPRAINWRYTDF